MHGGNGSTSAGQHPTSDLDGCQSYPAYLTAHEVQVVHDALGYVLAGLVLDASTCEVEGWDDVADARARALFAELTRIRKMHDAPAEERESDYRRARATARERSAGLFNAEREVQAAISRGELDVALQEARECRWQALYLTWAISDMLWCVGNRP